MLQAQYTKEVEELMKKFYQTLSEKDRRRYAAVEALKFGHGGQKYICEILGCDPGTVKLGNEELHHGSDTPENRIRKPGGGNKKMITRIGNIDEVFLEILKHNTAGSPMDEEIKWTNLRYKEISKAFREKGYEVSEHVVKQLLRKHKFVERKMRKTKTVKESKNRDEQFEQIKKFKEEYNKKGDPVISLDVKKRGNR